MGGGGGATSTSETTLTFEDTSQYIYRNSSEKQGGGSIEIGTIREDRDKDVAIAEDIVDSSDTLDAACRTQIKDMVTTLGLSVTAAEQDTTDMQSLAGQVWDAALALHDDVDAKLALRLDDLKAETLNLICSNELQWQRTAGSSLNCIVLSMKNKATTEMARRMAAVTAEMLFSAQTGRQEAIHKAFTDQLNARTQPRQQSFSHMGVLLQVLKGARVDTVRDRNVTESTDENALQTKAMANLFHSAKSIAGNDGENKGDADAYAAASAALTP